MDWVHLSPHFDDVALSCGGLVWEQSRSGRRVEIWTICGGDPPPGARSSFAESLHERWQTGAAATRQRRAEDNLACSLLGAVPRHLPYPDCIYRLSPEDGSPYYASETAIFGPLHPAEAGLVDELAKLLERLLPAPVNLVCPMAIGGHADHRMVRAAAERLGLPLWYYQDYPYVLAGGEEAAGLREGLEPRVFSLTTGGVDAWERAIAAYASQLSSFWPSLDDMRTALHAYHEYSGGICLWRQTSNNEDGKTASRE